MPCVGLAHWGSDILVVGQEIPTACVITGSCDLIVVDTLAGCPHICPDLKLYYSSPVVSTTTTASSRGWLNKVFFFFLQAGRNSQVRISKVWPVYRLGIAMSPQVCPPHVNNSIYYLTQTNPPNRI